MRQQAAPRVPASGEARRAAGLSPPPPRSGRGRLPRILRTLAFSCFLLAPVPLLAQTATTTLTIEVENSTVLEGSNIRWRVLADSPVPRNISTDVAITSGFFGTLGNTTSVITNGFIRKGKTEGTWSDLVTKARTAERDDTVTISFNSRRVFGDTANPYAFGDPVTVAVLDSDTPVVTISAPAEPISEGAAAVFTLRLTPSSDEAISVNVAYTGGEAGLPVEAGITFRTFNVNTSGSAGDSMVTATVLTGNGYVVSGDSTATVEVLDADAVVSISASETSIAEGESVEFTVTANPPPPSPRTARVDIAAGNFGFVGSSRREVMLAQGAPSATFSVSTLNDGEQESDGSLTATLASGPGYQLGTTATAAVTIEDSTGDPDVNASGSVDASDALILYYAYSLRNDLGNGR